MTASDADTDAVQVPAGVPAAVEPSPAQRAVTVPWWSEIRRSRLWADAILPTLLLRAVLLAFGVLAVVVFRGELLRGPLQSIWNRWDAPHFIEIAQYGYGPPADPARIVLFPVFPYLLRIVSVLTDPVTAGLLISLVATLLAAAGLYRLVRMDHGRSTARWAVLAMSLFPTAFSLLAPYSEAAFLAFAIWAFVFARQDNWRAAGMLTLLAGATRIQGLYLWPALALEYWLARRRIDRDAAWVLVGLGGPLLYLGINFITFGDPFYFLGIQRDVFKVTTLAPWVAIPNMIRGALAFQPTEFWATVYLAPLVSVVVLALVTLWTVVGRGSRPSYAVYSAISLLSFTTLSWPISVPRYLMGVFPIFVAAGRLGARPWLGPPLFVASTLLLGTCLTLFVIGHWAF